MNEVGGPRSGDDGGAGVALPFATDDNLFRREALRRAERAERIDFLAFRMGEEGYATPLAELLEVSRLPDLLEVPGVADPVLGLFSLRGTILPVLDLHAMLDVPRQDEPRRPRVVVLEHEHPRGTGWVGLRVDEFLGVLRAGPGTIETPSTSLQSGPVGLTGIVHLRGEGVDHRLAVGSTETLAMVFLLDLHQVLRERAAHLLGGLDGEDR